MLGRPRRWLPGEKACVRACTTVHHVTLINCTRCGVNQLKNLFFKEEEEEEEKVLSHESSSRFETEVVILHIIYGAQLTQQTGLL